MVVGPLNKVVSHIRRIGAARACASSEDPELLERFLASHDEVAFELLLDRHGPMVLGVCRRFLSDPNDADDAFQAAFLVLLRKAPSLLRTGSLAGWLHEVARRTALKARAVMARRRAQASPLLDVPCRGSEAEVVWRDLRPVLDEELRRLPSKYRLPVILCYLEGRTLEEAARQLGWPAGTVSGRLSRARGLLRMRLTKRGLGVASGLLGTLLAENSSASPAAPMLQGTLRAALGIVDKQRASSAAIPASVAALVEGVLNSMWWTKIKIATVLLITLLVAAGAGLSMQRLGAQPEVKKVETRRIEVKVKTKLQTLMENRLQAAQTELEARTQEFMAGRGTLDIVLGSSQRVLKAQQEMSKKSSDQIAALEDHLKRMKQIHEVNLGRFNAGRISLQDVKESEYYQLDAEIMLERAMAKRNPVGD